MYLRRSSHRPFPLHPVEMSRLLDSAIRAATSAEQAVKPKRYPLLVLEMLPEDRAKADVPANPERSALLVDSMWALPEGPELAEIPVLWHPLDLRRRLRRQKLPLIRRKPRNQSMRNLQKSCSSRVRTTPMRRGRCESRVKFCFEFCSRHRAHCAFST